MKVNRAKTMMYVHVGCMLFSQCNDLSVVVFLFCCQCARNGSIVPATFDMMFGPNNAAVTVDALKNIFFSRLLAEQCLQRGIYCTLGNLVSVDPTSLNITGLILSTSLSITGLTLHRVHENREPKFYF